MTAAIFVVSAFTTRPECKKCGYDRFGWEYRQRVGQGDPLDTIGTPSYEHLHLVCDRCSAAFDMETRDREGAK